MSDFHKLFVWQRSMELTEAIYQLANSLPKTERFNLCDQMHRAATSIPSNIAEGSNRTTVAARRQYIRIAYGSAQELESQLYQAFICQLISENEYTRVNIILLSVLRLLNCYYKNPCKKR